MKRRSRRLEKAERIRKKKEIVNTENKLTFSKQAYNDSIEKYEATRKSLLESLIVSMLS